MLRVVNRRAVPLLPEPTPANGTLRGSLIAPFQTFIAEIEPFVTNHSLTGEACDNIEQRSRHIGSAVVYGRSS
jgi:hypothetical protein